MKNHCYTIELFYSRSSLDYPDWLKNSTHNSLKTALARKAYLLKLTDVNHEGKLVKRWRADEIRIVECTRKVIR